MFCVWFLWSTNAEGESWCSMRSWNETMNACGIYIMHKPQRQYLGSCFIFRCCPWKDSSPPPKEGMLCHHENAPLQQQLLQQVLEQNHSSGCQRPIKSPVHVSCDRHVLQASDDRSVDNEADCRPVLSLCLISKVLNFVKASTQLLIGPLSQLSAMLRDAVTFKTRLLTFCSMTGK